MSEWYCGAIIKFSGEEFRIISRRWARQEEECLYTHILFTSNVF